MDEKKTDEIASLLAAVEALPQETAQKAGAYWKILGPGLTTGAADDDPSGIATYSQTGAQTGFQLLWLAPFSFALMAVIQEMCARIGLVTGRGLAANIRLHYPRRVLYFCTALLFIANTFNIGVDLGAMAEAGRLLNPRLSFTVLVILFALGSLLLQVFASYKSYARYLKYLALILLSYIFSALVTKLDWAQVWRYSLVPSIQLTKQGILLVCAILGTTISPYLFFWQTSQEVEEAILKGETTVALRRQTVSHQDIHNMRLDVWFGMFISNLVMFFIIAACAGTLYAHGVRDIKTVAQAAEALRPLAGQSAYLLFTIGIIGTGMLSIPILAGSASYAVSEAFHWKEGLNLKPRDGYGFYGVIAIAMLIGLSLNFMHIDPIKALLYSAVVNGIIAPFVLYLIVRLSSNPHVMGSWANGPLAKTIGWFVTIIMTVVGVAALVALVI